MTKNDLLSFHFLGISCLRLTRRKSNGWIRDQGYLGCSPLQRCPEASFMMHRYGVRGIYWGFLTLHIIVLLDRTGIEDRLLYLSRSVREMNISTCPYDDLETQNLTL